MLVIGELDVTVESNFRDHENRIAYDAVKLDAIDLRI